MKLFFEKGKAGVTALALFVAAPVLMAAQPSTGTKTLDRIKAVVGKEVILQSDIESQIAAIAQQNPRLATNDPELRKRVLDAIINEKLIIAKAIEDSVTVTEEEITQRLDFTLQGLIQQFGSEKRVEEVYQMPIAKIKREYREDIRKQLLAEKLRQQRFAEVKASTREVEEFLTTYKDSLPEIPVQVELYHITKYIAASNAAKETTLALAKKIRDSVSSGGDFADFAKRYSGDQASASAGGELGWVNKGNFVQEFEQAAYALEPGAISQPVESPFGYHIIQVIDKRRDAVNTRHILLKVGATQNDTEIAKEFLLGIRDSVRNGAKFEDMAKKYSDDKDTRGFGGSLGSIEIVRLPADFRSTIEAMPDGGVSEPQAYAADPTKPAMHIIYKKRTIPAHRANLKDDYKRIEQMAVAYKQNRLYEDWVKQLRTSMYWEVKD